MKKLDRDFIVKSVEDNGTFTGYASVFDEIDSDREVMKRGAFVKSLADTFAKGRKIPILWQHNRDQPVGVFNVAKEDDTGLYVEGSLNQDVQVAREALSLMKQGAVTGMSVGYRPINEKINQSSRVVEVLEVKLSEVSLVTFPACDSARISAVKSAIEDGRLPTLPEFEEFLREAGFSRTQAKAIAGGGLVKLARCEAGHPDRTAIAAALSILRKPL